MIAWVSEILVGSVEAASDLARIAIDRERTVGWKRRRQRPRGFQPPRMPARPEVERGPVR